jgi:hypothetical protein
MATETGEAEASITEVASTSEVGSASEPMPGPGRILIWSVDFAACDPDNPDDPERPAPQVTANVTLDDQDGAVVHAKAASVIDYESGAISRGAPVRVRYESPDETSGNRVWVFDLIDVAN